MQGQFEPGPSCEGSVRALLHGCVDVAIRLFGPWLTTSVSLARVCLLRAVLTVRMVSSDDIAELRWTLPSGQPGGWLVPLSVCLSIVSLFGCGLGQMSLVPFHGCVIGTCSTCAAFWLRYGIFVLPFGCGMESLYCLMVAVWYHCTAFDRGMVPVSLVAYCSRSWSCCSDVWLFFFSGLRFGEEQLVPMFDHIPGGAGDSSEQDKGQPMIGYKLDTDIHGLISKIFSPFCHEQALHGTNRSFIVLAWPTCA